MKKIILIIALLLLSTQVYGAVEDPSTFTVGGADAASISTTSTRMTSATLQDNDDGFGYKDYGADNFGEFDIEYTVVTDKSRFSFSHWIYVFK